jgi:hypothetical protein
MVKNYSNGKIYKIVGSGLTYFGSTCETTLARRLAKHISTYKCYKNGKGSYIRSYDIIELGEYTIVLLEKFSCECKDELHARERFYIENNACVNKNIPNRTNAEYRQDNKDLIILQKKEYYVHNIENISLRQNEKHNCKCGGKYT